ncbi:MAG: hypothetical protein ABIZ91_17465 [Gemmatimonadaceae bacterium]
MQLDEMHVNMMRRTDIPSVRRWQHMLSGAWREWRGRLHAAYARLVRDDVEQVLGCRLQLVGMLQRRTQQDVRILEDEVDAWLRRNLRLLTPTPVSCGFTSCSTSELATGELQ